MAKENVKKFYKELANSRELQEKLVKAQESYTGDTNDRQAMVEAIFLPIAQEAGFDFTDEELKTVEREMSQEKGVSEEELENVSGGGGFCILIGGNSKCEAKIKTWSWIPCLYACAYIGIGLDI